MEVDSNKIFSLACNETAPLRALDIHLNKTLWIISGQEPKGQNFDDGLIISGTVKNCTEPLFKAMYTEPLSFSEFPILHIVISGSPYVLIDFLIGLPISNNNVFEWIDLSSSQNTTQLIDDKQDHAITINVKEKIGVSVNMAFLMINANCSSLTREGSPYLVKIKELRLWNKMSYYLTLNEGKGYTLQEDKSVVFVIKKEDITIAKETHPYLQRVYILYSINAPNDALYTIFLAKKDGEKIIATRIGFLFSHSESLNRIGTHIDWRQPFALNSFFDPVSALPLLTSDEDYALIFSSVNNSRLSGVQLYSVELTFSKIPYSQFTIPNLSEQVLVISSMFLLVTAGLLPTLLMIILIYKYQSAPRRFSNNIVTKMIAAGIALRLILAPITAYADDLQIFTQLGALYFGLGIFGAQWVSLPGYVYIQTINYLPYALLRAIGFQDFQFLALAVYAVEGFITKLPSILSDLGSVYCLRKMSQKFMPDKEALIIGLFIFSPITIYTSAILGQFDSIFVFAIILSIYYLTTVQDNFKATLCTCFAALLNPVGIAMLIPLLIDAAKKRGVVAAFKSAILFCGAFGTSMLPFLFEPRSPVIFASYQRFLFGAPTDAFYCKIFSFCRYGSYILSSVGYGLTYRFLLELLGREAGPLVYPYGAAIAFSIFIILFLIKMYKIKPTDKYYNYYVGGFMLGTATLFQLTFPLIFDQFVVWIVGLLLVTYILFSNRKFLLMTVLTSITAGFVYIAVYRSYLLLVTGITRVAIGNPELANWSSAIIGVLYSIMLTTTLATLLILWLRPTQHNKTQIRM
ncbi:MAG: hypothetical protein ACP5IM_00875 [Candidatus Bathyarchaeia archaeon]